MEEIAEDIKAKGQSNLIYLANWLESRVVLPKMVAVRVTTLAMVSIRPDSTVATHESFY